MDRTTIFGLLLGGVSLLVGYLLEGCSGGMIFQVTAAVIVLGGTGGALCLSFSGTQLSHPGVPWLIYFGNLTIKVQQNLRDQAFHQDIRLMITGRGLVIHLPEFLFFETGEAQIRPQAEPLMNRLADLLREIPNPVVVEDHTDDISINTPQFLSNCELSVHRATNLVRYLIEKEHLDPSRFAAAGYGEYAPLASNDEETGRRLNRRVDIVIKPLLRAAETGG